MNLVSFADANGRITGSIGGDQQTITDNMPAGSQAIDGYWDGRLWWVDGSTVTARVEPSPLLPITSPGVVDLSGLPVGSSVAVTNEADEVTVIAAQDGLSLTDPGTYRIQILAPFPYLDAFITMELTND